MEITPKPTKPSVEPNTANLSLFLTLDKINHTLLTSKNTSQSIKT